MYFKNRAEAGRKLAAKLKKYDNVQCAVVALNSGGVIVGAQIAMRIHANLMILTSDNIMLPGEPEPLAVMTPGTFTYNKKLSLGQVDEYVGEYRGMIEEQRITKFHGLNKLLSDGGDIEPKYLRNHVVILVADALQTGVALDVAADFLKPIKIKKLVIATPLASVEAVDRMHLLGDEIHCLSVPDNLMDTNHYYEDNTTPGHKDAVKIIRNISMTWDLAPK
ncbi:MAG TPA: phosphoribosyltransferase family protein [Candidatus Saccharimonadales bacterium]|nr:phosphoribosyltransferase family protein [Candidatus Saccharimonadales bacterium]